MNAAFKAGSTARLYALPTLPITPGKAKKMIATGSKEMKEDFYKGLALTALLYAFLVLTSVLTEQFKPTLNRLYPRPRIRQWRKMFVKLRFYLFRRPILVKSENQDRSIKIKPIRTMPAQKGGRTLKVCFLSVRLLQRYI